MTSTPDAGSETMLHLTVPKGVAARAALRAAGDTSAPPPVLILEGVEFGHGEGFTFRVLGPPEPGSSEPGSVLAVAGMVGDRQNTLRPPRQEVTLAVPLNDRASILLVGRSEIILTLEVTNSPGRPPLKVDRAFFQDP
jgi:hypothetical protein